jgi:hypothetical protein
VSPSKTGKCGAMNVPMCALNTLAAVPDVLRALGHGAGGKTDLTAFRLPEQGDNRLARQGCHRLWEALLPQEGTSPERPTFAHHSGPRMSAHAAPQPPCVGLLNRELRSGLRLTCHVAQRRPALVRACGKWPSVTIAMQCLQPGARHPGTTASKGAGRWVQGGWHGSARRGARPQRNAPGHDVAPVHASKELSPPLRSSSRGLARAGARGRPPPLDFHVHAPSTCCTAAARHNFV